MKRMPSMPGAAIATGNVDFVLALADIPGALTSLVWPDAANA